MRYFVTVIPSHTVET